MDEGSTPPNAGSVTLRGPSGPGEGATSARLSRYDAVIDGLRGDMRNPRQPQGKGRADAAAMRAAYFAALMPLFVWLRYVAVGLGYLARQYPDVVAWMLPCIGRGLSC